eukprot:752615-Hanusia_phi.AAC.4
MGEEQRQSAQGEGEKYCGEVGRKSDGGGAERRKPEEKKEENGTTRADCHSCQHKPEDQDQPRSNFPAGT